MDIAKVTFGGRVEGIRPVSPRRPEMARNEGLTAERTRLKSRSSEEGSLTLTTAEGDKVTISFRNQQTAKLDQTRLYGPDGSFERTRVKSRESSQLAVSLEGNLSESELADITALVSKLSEGITSVRQGDTGGAVARLSESGSLGSIANYSFAYQQSEQTSLRATRISVMA